MDFLDKRIKGITDELNRLRISESIVLGNWKYKDGFYLRPEEADASTEDWKDFDSLKDHWYGKDRHYWFRTVFTIPESYDGKCVQLHLKTQIEEWDDAKNPQFLVFLDGKVLQGADMNHRDILVSEKAEKGRTYTLDLQAYSGILHEEFNLICNLEVLDRKIERLYYDIVVPLRAFSRLEKDSKARYDLERELNETINLLDLRTPYSRDFYQSLDEAEAYISKHVYEDLAGHDEVIASCIGHTHIDVAWWWTVAQTREKVARSFSTVLNLMKQYPSYKFMSSQPVLYSFLRERYPELYAEVKERVKEGRWEPEGGMWLEADCNLTSGESLVRQFMHGKKFFKDEFGVDNRILWLPDVFGYSGALPQIMKKCGIDYFMTTKLNWNQFDKMPHDTFMWKGIDGSKVLTHLVTTLGIDQPVTQFFTTYNGMLHPDAIIGGWQRYSDKDINNDILVCYGYGDGGGGPTKDMLETSIRMEKGIEGIPKVRQCGSLEWFKDLEKKVSDNRRLSTWEGELYFEYHRGTLTSMARNKRDNRKSELGLMDAELLSVLSGKDTHDELFGIWENVVLLNQFHDILPGSSIHEVYEVTKKEYAEILSRIGELKSEMTEMLAPREDGYVTIFNTTGFERNDVVKLDGSIRALKDGDGNIWPCSNGICYVEGIPSKGWKVFEILDEDVSSDEPAFRFDGMKSIETPFYYISFNEDGTFSSIYDKENRREILEKGKKGNELVMYEDKPIYYDNWDIDIFYTEKSWPVDDLAKFEWIEKGDEAAVLYVERHVSKSTVRQWISFYRDVRRIDFRTEVDWKEHQCLLKTHFNTNIHTDEATFDVQFGSVKRKTHTNTSWDKARFESCGQKWVDVSEGHYGVSLMNDSKYGHSVHNGEIGLTLIKSGVEPNPVTDQEMHYFTYSLYPHDEMWQGAGTVKSSYFLNQPMLVSYGRAEKSEYSFVECDAPNVVVETVKSAEDGRGVIVRLYESENSLTEFTLDFPSELKSAEICNLIEEDGKEIETSGTGVSLEIKPYEVLTLRVVF